jgi:hypothetical protein
MIDNAAGTFDPAAARYAKDPAEFVYKYDLKIGSVGQREVPTIVDYFLYLTAG